MAINLDQSLINLTIVLAQPTYTALLIGGSLFYFLFCSTKVSAISGRGHSQELARVLRKVYKSLYL
jgi:hypothetical protein